MSAGPGLAFFVVSALPAPGEFVLDGDEGRHAATVRRMRPGERLMLTDGQGSRAPAEVLAAGRGVLTLRVGDAVVDPPPAVRVVLVQALPKGERSDLAVDLATEAGVDEIVPWQAARCVARWAGSAGNAPRDTAKRDDAVRDTVTGGEGIRTKARRGRERWQSVAQAAAKQSRRSRIPQVRPLADTDDVVDLIGRSRCALVLHESGALPLASVTMPPAGDIALIVGPEGGIAPEELARFTDAGAVAVRLGPEVLRTSTAAAVALGALGVLAGRWG